MTTRTIGPVSLHGLGFDVAASSAQGPRSENQDAFAVDAFAESGIVAVADGMGGERAGRVAADTALSALLTAGSIRSLDAARYAVRAADEAVARAAQERPDERAGMGCALALLAAAPDRGGEVGWVGAHVGDVRILSRSPDGTVRLETRDHTPAYARWEAGEIALDEIPDTAGANKLQRAVGRGGEADASWIPLRRGWTYLIVSDGVTKAMRLDELGIAMAVGDATAACAAIERKVEERGPDDNYTIVAVRVLDPGDNATAPHPRTPLSNPTAAVNAPSRRSPLGIVATLLGLAALGLGGFALWTALQARADVAEVQRLETRIDSLGALIPPRVDTPNMDTAAAPRPAASTAAPLPAGATVPR